MDFLYSFCFSFLFIVDVMLSEGCSFWGFRLLDEGEFFVVLLGSGDFERNCFLIEREVMIVL